VNLYGCIGRIFTVYRVALYILYTTYLYTNDSPQNAFHNFEVSLSEVEWFFMNMLVINLDAICYIFIKWKPQNPVGKVHYYAVSL
jgi:hypothetical protein